MFLFVKPEIIISFTSNTKLVPTECAVKTNQTTEAQVHMIAYH